MPDTGAVEPSFVSPPPGIMVRVGWREAPLKWRRPPLIEDEDDAPLLGTNRFDAPADEYRTVYLADGQYGAWLEKLAPFRLVAGLHDRIAEATSEDDGDPPDQGDLSESTIPLSTPGAVPADFFEDLVLVEARLSPEALVIDVEGEETMQALSVNVGRRFLERFGLDRFDRGVALHRDRRITRHLALELYLMAAPAACGLRCTSVHAAGVTCWALWESSASFILEKSLAPVDLSNPELQNAAATLGVTLPKAQVIKELPDNLPRAW